LSQPPERSWPLVDRQGRRVDAPIAGSLECSDAQLQAEALYAGFGIGLRPADEVRRAESTGTLERVLPGFRHRPFSVWLVSPQARSRIPRVAAVAELLQSVIGRFSE
jgi:DNA-binding transcriptional LysR family regulator